MNNQGFIYAVLQYFTVEDKPRLNRRNTWFRDHHMSDDTAIRLILSFFILAIAIISYSMMGGIL